MVREVAAEEGFFKVLLPGSHQKLNLPPAFCKNLQEDEPEGAILESRKGTWKIETCRNGEGVISFEDGWPEFAHHHNLSVGDFVVFEHTGQLHFNVVVFGRNGCEKEFPVGSKRGAIEAGKQNRLHRKIRRKPDKKSGVSYHSKDPYFAVTMTPFLAAYKGELAIPIEFFASNDFGKKKWLSLKDPAGEVWVGKLYVRKYPFRCRMRTGWRGFYVSNELKDGDVCVFVLNQSSQTSPATVSFDVKIIRASARN